MVSVGEHCEDIMSIYPVYKLPGYDNYIGAFLFAIALIYFFNSFIILYWIRKQEDAAKLGDHKAVKSVIFPVFVDVMWLNAAINFYVGVILLSVDQPTRSDNTLSCFLWASFTGLQHMITEGVAYMLTQKGLGRNTQALVFRRAIVWGFISFLVRFLSYKYDSSGLSGLLILWESLLLLFYAGLAFSPTKIFYRRPSGTFFARFWVVWSAITFIAVILEVDIISAAAGNCVEVFGTYLIYALFQPLIVYVTLLRDSRWWQGQFAELEEDGTNASHDRPTSKDIVSPLQGLSVNLHSAQSLAETVDRMIAEKGVTLLNFAYIELYEDQLLGQGSFSKVYRGKFRQQDCAIKLVFTVDLTVDVIRRMAAEAQLLAALKHTNIIYTFGVAVLPPSVCILLEVCAYGSLSDVIRGKMDNSETKAIPVSYTDTLFLALGCARGLAVLHNFGSSHRDIKSLNFLVDCQLNAKLADMELGGTAVSNHTPIVFPVIQSLFNYFSKPTLPTNANAVYRESIRVSQLDRKLGTTIPLPHWMAPEVLITPDAYTRAADCFSFGVVLWELLCKRLPYDDIEDVAIIRDKIINGDRLPIASSFHQGKIDERLLELITTLWHRDPKMRPKMLDVVTRLEELYAGICYDRVVETHAVVDLSPLNHLSTPRPSRKLVDVLTRTPTTEFASPMSPAAVDPANSRQQVLDALQSDPCWRGLENDPDFHIHCVISCTAPHVLIKANYKFYSEFGFTPSDIGKVDFAQIITANHGPKSCMQSMQNVDLLKLFTTDLVQSSASHMVLELTNKSSGFVGLYSVHYYPILCKRGNLGNMMEDTEDTEAKKDFRATSLSSAMSLMNDTISKRVASKSMVVNNNYLMLLSFNCIQVIHNPDADTANEDSQFTDRLSRMSRKIVSLVSTPGSGSHGGSDDGIRLTERTSAATARTLGIHRGSSTSTVTSEHL